jgi:hypothetical protein
MAVAALAAAPAAAPAATKVRAPKDGATYKGKTERNGRFSLTISGKSIQILAIKFKCHDTFGHTSLQDVPLKKTKRGYKFAIDSFGIVSYDDAFPDENARIEIYGQFTKRARSATGRLKVRPPRCGTGLLDWKIKR